MNQRNVLAQQLEIVNQSLFYLLVIIASVLISFCSTLIQRGQVEDALLGKPQRGAADVFPLRLTASALSLSALVFFFCLALRTCRDAAQGDDPAVQKSAGMNVWASAFVLTASLIRLYDLNFTQAVQPSLAAENTQPE